MVKFVDDYVYISVDKDFIIQEFKFNKHYMIEELRHKRVWEIISAYNKKVWFLDDNRVLFKQNEFIDDVLTFCFKSDKKFKIWDVDEEKYSEVDVHTLIEEFALVFKYNFFK